MSIGGGLKEKGEGNNIFLINTREDFLKGGRG
jgi:hypothetical protein